VPKGKWQKIVHDNDSMWGDKTILDVSGREIARITKKSLNRLEMEGTGRLPDGRVVNVSQIVNGRWRFKVMSELSPYGKGLRGQALYPWKSLAANINDINKYKLFGRKVVIPHLKGTLLPDGSKHDGIFYIHDTGGAMKPAPYSKGLFRNAPSKTSSGQFDVFVYYPEMYWDLLKSGKWQDFKEVIVWPRDLESPEGIQETVNLLIDEGLDVDGTVGELTTKGIKNLQEALGEEDPSGKWTEETKKLAEEALNSWG